MIKKFPKVLKTYLKNIVTRNEIYRSNILEAFFAKDHNSSQKMTRAYCKRVNNLVTIAELKLKLWQKASSLRDVNSQDVD